MLTDYLLALIEFKLGEVNRPSFVVSFLNSQVETNFYVTNLGLFVYSFSLVFAEQSVSNFSDKVSKKKDCTAKDFCLFLVGLFIIADFSPFFAWLFCYRVHSLSPCFIALCNYKLAKELVTILFAEEKAESSLLITKSYNPVYLSKFMERLEQEEDF